jgi:hypothetical protein
VVAEIQAIRKWNKTGIHMVAGQEYMLSAKGEWIDWFIQYGPDGGASRSNLFLKLFEWARRMPHENWFALIGAIDSDQRTAFLIGSSRVYRASVSGELTCYANDVPWAYGNNKGSVTLNVRMSAGSPVS